MASADLKRISVRLKCPNPLFEQWLLAWKEEAAAKESKMQHTFSKALQSLRKYPLPLESGKECKILKGFGDKLCKMLDDKLHKYKETHKGSQVSKVCNNIDNDELLSPDYGVKKSLSPKSRKGTGCHKNEYIPQFGSGAYGILVTLYKQSLNQNYPGFLTKADIIRHAKDIVDSSFTKPLPGSRYTAWSSMRTLISKNLVSKISHPPKFSLTDKGIALAKKLYLNSATDHINEKLVEESKPIEERFGISSKSTALYPKSVENRSFDLDIPDEFADEFLQIPWPENESHLSDIANLEPNYHVQINFNLERNKTGNSQIYTNPCVENVTGSHQSKAKIPLVKFSSTGSVATVKLAENATSCSNLEPKKTVQKFRSSGTIIDKNIVATNKQKSLNRCISSSSVTSTKSVIESFVMTPGAFDIILYVDTNETSGFSNSHNDEILVGLTKQGIRYEVKDLKISDFTWICRDKTTKKELVLPYAIERKRMDDFAQSIKDKRYNEQKFRLKRSGIQNLTYLVESYGRNQHLGLPLSTLFQASTNTAIQDNFFIKFTDNIRDTVDYLANFSRLLIKIYKSKTLSSCCKEDLPHTININEDVIALMTFKEFNESSVKNKRMTVTDLFVKMLIQIKGMSVERALAIVQIYPSPSLLKRAYEDNPQNKGETLLSGIKFGKYGKSIGAVLSKTIYQAFTKQQY